jgi:prepilin-type N-terminal cleavage/methylation domain-containing protein
MQLSLSHRLEDIKVGTNTDIKKTTAPPAQDKMINTQSLWFRFPRAAFAGETGQRITPIAQMEMDRTNKPWMTRILFCRGSRVGCDRQSTIKLATGRVRPIGGHQTSNIKHSFHGFTLPKQRERVSAFTLIELLVVMAIIAILLLLVAPAFTNMKSSGDFTSAVYGIRGLLDNARTYAKANHTYVFVGFAEVDASVNPSVSPQVAGSGRVAVAAVASKDGTRQVQYTSTTPAADWSNNYNNGAHLIALGKLQTFENLHFLVNFPSWTPNAHPASNMARNQPLGGTAYTLGIAPSSVTPFSWPLGSSLNSGQYQFNKVINFDPTGIARIAYSGNADEIAQVMEIDFQQTHGTVTPTPPTNQDVGNQVVIQIAPTSGAIRVYRP